MIAFAIVAGAVVVVVAVGVFAVVVVRDRRAG